MKILDLFCGAGGAGEGYKQCGFEVTGIDNILQPKNPHKFILADAFEYLISKGYKYDAIHASPPCQAYSKSTLQWRNEGYKYPDVIKSLRKLLIMSNKPYIIENVPGAPLINPIYLNGSSFNIKIHRLRLFETNFKVIQPKVPHIRPVKMGRPVKEGDVLQPVGHFSGVSYAKKEMGISWMGQKELAQAIPPIYTKYIGKFLIKELCYRGVVSV